MTDQYRASLASMSGESFSQTIEELRATAALHQLPMSSGGSTPAGAGASARPVRSSVRKAKMMTPVPGTPGPVTAAAAQPSTPMVSTPQTTSYYPQYYAAAATANYATPAPNFQTPLAAAAIPTAQAMATPVAPLLQSIQPLQPIPTVQQARVTTYASRMRTGATLLMQPILAPSGTTVAAAVAALTTTSTVRAGRARAQINYAEGASGDEFEDDSDDEDFSNSKREAAAKRARATGAGSLQAALAASSTELDQSYLGKQPPSKYISSKLAVPTKHKYDYLDVMEAAAAKRELLVPIKVEVDTDTHRIRDCFTWNLNEELITPQAFAQTFCADLDLPFHHVDTIVNMIRAQLDEHSGVVAMDVGGNDDDPTIEEPDCRVILRLDVQLDNYHLVDHIEWDLCSSPATPDTTPEAFAKQLCADLGLRGEAIPIVAHALHEEIIKHKKDAVEWGVLGGLGAVPEDGGYRRNQRGPRRLRGVWRDWLEYKDYGPTLEVLTPEELEKKEMERERASRRMRRETSKFQRTAGAYYRDSRPPRPSRLR